MTHDAKREMVQVRVGKAGIARLDALAADLNTNRSELIRTALSIALAYPEQVAAHIKAKQEAM